MDMSKQVVGIPAQELGDFIARCLVAAGLPEGDAEIVGALFLANPSLGRIKNGWRTVLGNFYGSIASKSTATTASRFASVTGMR